MKKNILTIIILALALINVVLSATIIFVVIPSLNKTTKLVNQVASIIDLELDSPDQEEVEVVVPIKNRVPYTLANENTITLASEPGSTKLNYVKLNLSLTLNKKSKAYKTLQPKLTETEPWITEILADVLGKYTTTQLRNNTEEAQKEVLKRLKEKYESNDFIIEVVFGAINYS